MMQALSTCQAVLSAEFRSHDWDLTAISADSKSRKVGCVPQWVGRSVSATATLARPPGQSAENVSIGWRPSRLQKDLLETFYCKGTGGLA